MRRVSCIRLDGLCPLGGSNLINMAKISQVDANGLFVGEGHPGGKLSFSDLSILEGVVNPRLIIWVQCNCVPGNDLLTESNVT